MGKETNSSHSVLILVPFSSIQHFVWPLHWCLLADICNHTWIPECGTNNPKDQFARRLFIDECDMYEYNCDHEADYVMINYSDCFSMGVRPCPTSPPCPSRPTCPDHRFHKMGQKFIFVTSKYKVTVIPPRRRFPTLPPRTTPFLPPHMLRGKRRYMSYLQKKLEQKKETAQMNKEGTKSKSTMRTLVVKKEVFAKNGKTYIRKYVKGFQIVTKKGEKPKTPLTFKDSVDFLE